MWGKRCGIDRWKQPREVTLFAMLSNSHGCGFCMGIRLLTHTHTHEHCHIHDTQSPLVHSVHVPNPCLTL